MSTSTLKLWSNPNLELFNQQVNIGDSWVIDPDGPIVEPTECVAANPTPGILKVYRNLHPNSLVIHWLYPNFRIGHILWVSKAPLRLTTTQVKTVRSIEKQLAREWEYATRWELGMCTPPPVRISLGSREVHSHQRPSYRSARSRSGSCPCRSLSHNYRALRQVA